MRAISNWLESHARFRPEAEALFDVDTDRHYTYRQLHHDSLRWARRLHEAGVRPKDRVGLLADNCAEHLLLLFACAELGATFFPMNWRLSDVELGWQVENCRPRVCYADAANRGRLASARPMEEPLPVEGYEGVGPQLEDPWVLMYTSGSTGKPKGALLTHRQLHWNAVNTTLACDLNPTDATLTFTPMFHTGGLNCLSSPLLHRGGRVVLVRKLDVGQALKLIAEERVSVLMGVPTIYQMLADHPAFEHTDLSSVKDALCGGAPLSMPLLERYLARGIPLRQGFGMTEVGPNCFSMPHERIRDKIDSVGLPIHHVSAKIMRADGRECEVDEPGELWLGGPAVFGGYLDNPSADAAAFVDGWVRTGDILCRDAEGFFRVRGRLKEMFISGGENVYPAEVEAVLQSVSGVAHAAVIGVADDRWGEVGHAYVEPRSGHSLDVPALLAAAKRSLASFKVPKRVVVLDELPRTASGKIDKPKLAAMQRENAS